MQAPPASLQPLLSNNLNLAMTTIDNRKHFFHFDILFFQPNEMRVLHPSRGNVSLTAVTPSVDSTILRRLA